MRIFVTGGAGYIGSHTALQLLRDNHEVCVFENYCNSSPVALDRVRLLANAGLGQVEGDIRDEKRLSAAIADFRPDAVIHFAGLKAVGESAEQPLDYYENNVQGSVVLLKAMQRSGCERIVFSSSATVYGAPVYLPFDEAHPLAPVNAYGRTKYFIEEIIGDWTRSRPSASAVLLRYFNPVGADGSGLIGEAPGGAPNNLMPFISQVAVGKRDALVIFGGDYDTRDGTGERDYIHVADLALAHVAALSHVSTRTGCEAFNIGTGKGTTVLELIRAFERASGRDVPFRMAGRRAGDIASSVASAAKARDLLGWRAALDIDAMCRSAWIWQSRNPDGYRAP